MFMKTLTMDAQAISLKLFTQEADMEPYIQGLFKGNQENDAFFQWKNEAGEISKDVMIVMPEDWNEKTFAKLKNRKPYIKHLLIYIATENEACDQLHLLISKYPQLESLAICGKFNLTSTKQNEIFDNEMHSLKRLDFRCTNASVYEKCYEFSPGQYLNFYVSSDVLSKLEHFSLVPCFLYYIPEIIVQLGVQLKSLRLDRIPFTELTLDHFNDSFLKLNPSLLKTVVNLSLTALGVEGDQQSLRIFNFICENFKNLEALQFNLPRKSETPLYFEFLKSLTGLCNLKKLHFGFLYLKNTRDENGNQSSSSSLLQFSLPSVTDLSFYFIPIKFDSDYFTKLTSTCFTNLKSLLLKPTREFDSKYDFLSEQQLNSFPAQMEYEAYTSKSKKFSLPPDFCNGLNKKY